MNELLPLMTYSLLISISLISIIGFNNTALFDQCKHYPYLENKQKSFYRWFTCGFLHANWLHLFFNAFVLWQFGSVIEKIYKEMYGMMLGGILFIVIYVLILILSCIPTYIKFKNNPQYSSIGASGAISGILFIYILYFPFNLLYLFGMIPVPAIVFGFLYLYYSWWASRNTNDHIDHDAHYYGAVMGLLFGVIIKYLL
ncbi:MAG: rhomboid family intramembrane serine protease [Saprospiraceae bacterium]|nr:rhomboid family intramembrane serine protease [Saprospiraceae bacterium]